MFKKDDFLIDAKTTKIESKDVETLIGPSVKVEGDFVGDGDVVVEGTVTGKLKTKRNLRVGQGAKILASVGAENALVSGFIQGNLKIKNKLELTSTAKILGDIETKILLISEGAAFTGHCKMVDEASAASEQINKEAKEIKEKDSAKKGKK